MEARAASTAGSVFQCCAQAHQQGRCCPDSFYPPPLPVTQIKLQTSGASSSAYLGRLLLTSARQWSVQAPSLWGPWLGGGPGTCFQRNRGQAGVHEGKRKGERTELGRSSFTLCSSGEARVRAQAL